MQRVNITFTQEQSAASAPPLPTRGQVVVSLAYSALLNFALVHQRQGLKTAAALDACKASAYAAGLLAAAAGGIGPFRLVYALCLCSDLAKWAVQRLLRRSAELHPRPEEELGLEPLRAKYESACRRRAIQCLRSAAIVGAAAAMLWGPPRTPSAVVVATAFAALAAAHTLASHAFVAFLHYWVDPAAAAAEHGSVRGRLLMLLSVLDDFGGAGGAPAALLDPPLGSPWKEMWCRAGLEAHLWRMHRLSVLCSVIQATIAGLAPRTVDLAIQVEAHQMAELRQRSAESGGAPPPAITDAECVAWAEARGARSAAAWWGGPTEVCSICCDPLLRRASAEGGASVTCFPCEGRHNLHAFHTPCLRQWLSARPEPDRSCPLCRSRPMAAAASGANN